MTKTKVILGLVAGAAIGAVLGVLFAPDKGSATRKKLLDQGNDHADALSTKFNTMMGDLNTQATRIREEAERMVSEARSKAEKHLVESNASPRKSKSPA